MIIEITRNGSTVGIQSLKEPTISISVASKVGPAGPPGSNGAPGAPGVPGVPDLLVKAIEPNVLISSAPVLTITGDADNAMIDFPVLADKEYTFDFVAQGGTDGAGGFLFGLLTPADSIYSAMVQGNTTTIASITRQVINSPSIRIAAAVWSFNADNLGLLHFTGVVRTVNAGTVTLTCRNNGTNTIRLRSGLLKVYETDRTDIGLS
jgi:hypothetical protein